MPRRLSMGGLFNLLEKLYGKTHTGADSKIHTSEQISVVLGK